MARKTHPRGGPGGKDEGKGPTGLAAWEAIRNCLSKRKAFNACLPRFCSDVDPLIFDKPHKRVRVGQELRAHPDEPAATIIRACAAMYQNGNGTGTPAGGSGLAGKPAESTRARAPAAESPVDGDGLPSGSTDDPGLAGSRFDLESGTDDGGRDEPAPGFEKRDPSSPKNWIRYGRDLYPVLGEAVGDLAVKKILTHSPPWSPWVRVDVLGWAKELGAHPKAVSRWLRELAVTKMIELKGAPRSRQVRAINTDKDGPWFPAPKIIVTKDPYLLPNEKKRLPKQSLKKPRKTRSDKGMGRGTRKAKPLPVTKAKIAVTRFQKIPSEKPKKKNSEVPSTAQPNKQGGDSDQVRTPDGLLNAIGGKGIPEGEDPAQVEARRQRLLRELDEWDQETGGGNEPT